MVVCVRHGEKDKLVVVCLFVVVFSLQMWSISTDVHISGTENVSFVSLFMQSQ